MGSQYYNYKGTHSIIMMVVAGGSYEVIWADVGANGRMYDGAVLKNSKFGQKLTADALNLPEPLPLPNRTEPTPYVFIGDDVFALSPNLMKPYSKDNLDIFSRVCNYRFSRARRISENVFGILTSRWRIFLTTIALHPGKVRKICLSILSLHNWLLKSNCYVSKRFVDRINPETGAVFPGAWRDEIGDGEPFIPLQPVQYAKNPTMKAKQVREEFNEYFNLEGSVPWQWENCILNEI